MLPLWTGLSLLVLVQLSWIRPSGLFRFIFLESSESLQTFGRTPWMGFGPSQGLYLGRTTHYTANRRGHARDQNGAPEFKLSEAYGASATLPLEWHLSNLSNSNRIKIWRFSYRYKCRSWSCYQRLGYRFHVQGKSDVVTTYKNSWCHNCEDQSQRKFVTFSVEYFANNDDSTEADFKLLVLYRSETRTLTVRNEQNQHFSV
jgi:hypothetical protein